MKDIITIGSITRDLFLKIPKTYEVKNNNFSLKKGVLFPIGQKLKIEKTYFSIGGNATNAAIGFARQGLKVACLGSIGKDIGGKEILKKLKKEKVSTNLIHIDQKLPTSYSIIFLTKKERTILNYSGASLKIKIPQDITKIKAKYFYISPSFKSVKLLNKIINFAYQNNIFIAFNPTFWFLKNHADKILKLLEKISIFVLNEEEAALLLKLNSINDNLILKKLNKINKGIIVITRGEKGSYTLYQNSIYKAGIFNTQIVDKTGAGDTFASTFIATLIKNKIHLNNLNKISEEIITKAILNATINSGMVVKTIGATEGILSIKEIKKIKNKIKISKFFLK